MVTPMHGFRLPESLVELLRDPCEGPDKTAAFLNIAAAGIKYRMRDHVKPISKKFLDSFSPSAIFDLYKQYKDAICFDAGLHGCLGSKHRFEALPAGSEFSEVGKITYVILSDRQILDPSGNIWTR